MNGTVRAAARPSEAASYIEQTSAQLRDLAQSAGFPFLGYLLDMARLEAATRTAGASGPVAVPPSGD